MKKSFNKTALLALAGLTLMTSPAVAQNTMDADGTETRTTTVREEEDDFPWGLLGLLGLAGLLGRKRNERDIHVDARRDTTRP